MEDLVKTLKLASEGAIPKEVLNTLRTRLKDEKSVLYLKVRSDQLNISFPSYKYSQEYILRLLKECGFHIKSNDKRSLWNKLLDSIIKGNKQAYGDKPLECCKLNK